MFEVLTAEVTKDIKIEVPEVAVRSSYAGNGRAVVVLLSHGGGEVARGDTLSLAIKDLLSSIPAGPTKTALARQLKQKLTPALRLAVGKLFQ